MKIKSNGFLIFFILLIIVLIILFPDISKSGVTRGLILSSNVIVPSLFPFMVCVIMLIKAGIKVENKHINTIIYKLFGHNFSMFFTFLFSMLGGYPTGGKMIGEMYKKGLINQKSANIMLTYCVNAGPAFIISVAGGVFASKMLGIILLFSQILSSIFIALVSSKKLKKQVLKVAKPNDIAFDLSNCLVESVRDATESILNICSFVILFSALTSYFDYFFGNVTIIKNISMLFEVTSAIYKTKNIYFISFLLGFSGVSVWCQIFSISKNIKINKVQFIVGRILHGLISLIVTKSFLKIFKVKTPTFYNNVSFKTSYLYSDVALLFAIGLMLIVLMIYIYTKNNSGKIIEDVL